MAGSAASAARRGPGGPLARCRPRRERRAGPEPWLPRGSWPPTDPPAPARAPATGAGGLGQSDRQLVRLLQRVVGRAVIDHHDLQQTVGPQRASMVAPKVVPALCAGTTMLRSPALTSTAFDRRHQRGGNGVEVGTDIQAKTGTLFRMPCTNTQRRLPCPGQLKESARSELSRPLGQGQSPENARGGCHSGEHDCV